MLLGGEHDDSMFYPSPYAGRFRNSETPFTPPRNAPDLFYDSFDWPMSAGEKSDRRILLQGSALKDAQMELKEQEEERERNDAVVAELKEHCLGVQEQADALYDLSDQEIKQWRDEHRRLEKKLQAKERELAAKNAQLAEKCARIAECVGCRQKDLLIAEQALDIAEKAKQLAEKAAYNEQCVANMKRSQTNLTRAVEVNFRRERALMQQLKEKEQENMELRQKIELREATTPAEPAEPAPWYVPGVWWGGAAAAPDPQPNEVELSETQEKIVGAFNVLQTRGRPARSRRQRAA